MRRQQRKREPVPLAAYRPAEPVPSAQLILIPQQWYTPRMATKQKSKKKSGKKSVSKRLPKNARAKKPAKRQLAVTTKYASTKTASRKSAPEKAPGRAKAAAPNKRLRGKSDNVDTVTFEPAGLGARSGGQSGDLQGLSNHGRSNSESVDELLEEGNSFEAGIVQGVEDAADADEHEVRTREVPEDDVPAEYLDEDK